MMANSDGIDFTLWPAGAALSAKISSKLSMPADLGQFAQVKTTWLSWSVTITAVGCGFGVSNQVMELDGSFSAEDVIQCIKEETGDRCQNLDFLMSDAGRLQGEHDILRREVGRRAIRTMANRLNASILDGTARARR